MRVAAVDIGTNSCRLLIAERGEDGGRPTPLDRRLTITRLGEDVDATGRLAKAAIDRTVEAVEGYAAAWRDAGVERVGITATSASRDADNAEDFRQAILDVADVEPRVLSGQEEAAMAFAGALSALPDVTRPVALLDIGGGSTEVVVGGGASHPDGRDRPDRSTSRQLGCVRLTERVMPSDPPTPGQIAVARRTTGIELDAVEELVDPATAATLVAVAGTATTLAAVHLDLDRWADGAVHGTTLTAAEVHDLAERLLRTPVADIAAMPAVQAGREDVLAAGALILDEVLRRFGFGEVTISEADILDGLALELLTGG